MSASLTGLQRLRSSFIHALVHDHPRLQAPRRHGRHDDPARAGTCSFTSMPSQDREVELFATSTVCVAMERSSWSHTWLKSVHCYACHQPFGRRSHQWLGVCPPGLDAVGIVLLDWIEEWPRSPGYGQPSCKPTPSTRPRSGKRWATGPSACPRHRSRHRSTRPPASGRGRSPTANRAACGHAPRVPGGRPGPGTTGTTTSFLRRNHGVQGGSKRANRGQPTASRPAEPRATRSCSVRF